MKKTVAVLFGGRSVEHEISVITGLEVLGTIDTERYDPTPVYIDARGRWFTGDALTSKDFYRGLPQTLDQVTEVVLLPTPGARGLKVVESQSSGFKLFSKPKEEVLVVDVFFPAFHGQFGEDGCIQGLFELADVIYTGCNVGASAIAMNKFHCKAILSAQGVPVLPGIIVEKAQAQRGLADVRATIVATEGLREYPLFVKPLTLGSSIGVGRAGNEQELTAALAKAFEFDSYALVEPCVTELLEINVSVLEGPDGPTASVVEIPVPSKDTLTYEDKYLRGGKGKKGGPQRVSGMASLSRVIDPEDLDSRIKEMVRAHAITAFKALQCAGCVRFDFMLNLATQQLYFNELNPLPGSLAHYLWAKSKPAVLYTEMLTRMIEAAVQRKEVQRGLKRDLGFKALFA